MKQRIEKICKYCGETFIAVQHRRVHCSDQKCRYARYKDTNERGRFEAHIKSKYGLTLDRYDQMLADQGGVCKICRKPQVGTRRNERMSIDHDHMTGEVRGILCHQCNAGLGWFRDDPILLRSAADYLEKK